MRSIPVALALVFGVANLAEAATYKIDPDHSSVSFKVRHLAISSVKGKFIDFSGTFTYDPQQVASSTTEAEVAVKSVSTNQTKRDQHLLGPEFLDVAKWSKMTFKGKEVKNVTAQGFKLLGDLTIRDVTKPVTLDVTVGGEAKDPWGNERAAFIATTVLNRKDFGLTYNKALETGGLVVGEEVQIEIEIEGVKAQT